jgi:hypothetical protein
VLFAITVHEAAHGYAARHFGDNTAAMMGRITLNPMKHIDPVGTILMPLLLFFATSGAFLFGYAKPVPVRFGNLRNPKRDMIWVALGRPRRQPGLQAMAWMVLLYLLHGASAMTEPFFRQDVPGRRPGQRGDVRVQPVPAAAAGRRAHPGGAAASTSKPCWSRASNPGASSSSWRWWCPVWSAPCGCNP